MQLGALFRLAFATAPLLSKLTSLHTSNSPAHYAKGTPSGPKPLRLLVGIRFQELFHSPSRSAFHLSLTGTSTLSVTREYLALEGGPPRFPQGFSCPVVLGNSKRKSTTISPTGLSPSVAELSRTLRLWCRLVTSRRFCISAP